MVDIVLWPMLAFFTFSKGYYCICKRPQHEITQKVYYAVQVFQNVLFFIFTIVRTASFNGLSKIAVLKQCDLGFPVLLAVFEILSYWLVVAVGGFCMYKISKELEDARTFEQAPSSQAGKAENRI